MAGEQCILAIEGNRPDEVFDALGIHPDASIGQEHPQAIPVERDVAFHLQDACEQNLSGILCL